MMTKAQRTQFNRMRYVLRKISRMYQKPQQMKKHSETDWGVDYEEALEMAYENIQQEAAKAVSGIKEIPHPNSKKPEKKKITRKILVKVGEEEIQAHQVILFRISRKRWITKDGKELSDEFIEKHWHQLPFAKDGGLGFVILK